MCLQIQRAMRRCRKHPGQSVRVAEAWIDSYDNIIEGTQA